MKLLEQLNFALFEGEFLQICLFHTLNCNGNQTLSPSNISLTTKKSLYRPLSYLKGFIKLLNSAVDFLFMVEKETLSTELPPSTDLSIL